MVGGEWNFHASETHRNQPLTTLNDITKGFNLQSYNAELVRFKKACQIFQKEYGKGIIVRWSTPDSQRKDNVFASFSYFCNKHTSSGLPVNTSVSAGETIKAGTLVEVYGLIDKKSLNGEKGLTEEFSSTPGRVGVRLFDGRSFALKANNLKVLPLAFTHSWTLYIDPRKQHSLGTNLNADCQPLFGVDFDAFKVFCYTFQYHLSRKFGFHLSLSNGLRGTEKDYSFRSEGARTIINKEVYRTVEYLNKLINLNENDKKLENNLVLWQNAKKWNKELIYVAKTTGDLFAGKAQHEQWLRMILDWFPDDQQTNQAKQIPPPSIVKQTLVVGAPQTAKQTPGAPQTAKKTPSPTPAMGDEPECIDLSDSEPDQDMASSVPPASLSPQPSTSSQEPFNPQPSTSSSNPQPSTSSIKMVNIEKLTNPNPHGNPIPHANLIPQANPISDPISISEQFLAGHSIFGSSLPTSVIQPTVTSTPAVSAGRFAPKPSFEGLPIPKRTLFNGRPSTSNVTPAPMCGVRTSNVTPAPMGGVREVKLVFDLPSHRHAGFDLKAYQDMMYEAVSTVSKVNSGGGGCKIKLNECVPKPDNNIFSVISYGCHKHVVKNAMHAFPGTLVQVINLSKKPQLNGKRGTIQSRFDPASGRLKVLLEEKNADNTEKLLEIKPQNIHVVEFSHNWTLFLDPRVRIRNPSDIRLDCMVQHGFEYPRFLQTIQGLQQNFAQRFGFRVTAPIQDRRLAPNGNPIASVSTTKRINPFPDRNGNKRARVEVPLPVVTKTPNSTPKPNHSGATGSNISSSGDSRQSSSVQKSSPVKSSTQVITSKWSNPNKTSSPKQATPEAHKSRPDDKSSPMASISELLDSPEKDKTSLMDISGDVVEVTQNVGKTMYDKVKERRGEKEKTKSPESKSHREHEKNKDREQEKSSHRKHEKSSHREHEKGSHKENEKSKDRENEKSTDRENENSSHREQEKNKDSDLDDFKIPKSSEKKTRNEQDEEISRLKTKLEKYQTRLKRHKDISNELEKEKAELSKRLNKTELDLKENEKKQGGTAECMNLANKSISELRTTISELRAESEKKEEASKKKIEQLEYELKQCQQNVDDSMAEIQARDAKILKLQITQSPVMIKKEDKSECDEDHDAVKRELEKLKSKMSKMKDLLKIKDNEIASYKSMAFDSDDEDDKVKVKLPKKEDAKRAKVIDMIDLEAIKCENDDDNVQPALEAITNENDEASVQPEEEDNNPFKNLEIEAITIKEEPDMEPVIAAAPKAAKFFSPDFDDF